MALRNILTLALLAGLTSAVKVNEHVQKRDFGLKALVKKVMGDALPLQDKIFKGVDRDGDGFISLEDLHSMYLKDAGDAIMEVADLDKDGKLTPLEFFGTTTGSTGVTPEAGDPASGAKPWAERNFDEFLDTANGDGSNVPDLCSKEFWEWAAEEWRQRPLKKLPANPDASDITEQKATGRDWLLGSNHNIRSIKGALGAMHREMSVVGSPLDAMWDVCANLLPAQKLSKLKIAKFVDWQQCYYKALKELSQSDNMEIVDGVPRTKDSRTKAQQFYLDYYAGDKSTCGIEEKKRASVMSGKWIGKDRTGQ